MDSSNPATAEQVFGTFSPGREWQMDVVIKEKSGKKISSSVTPDDFGPYDFFTDGTIAQLDVSITRRVADAFGGHALTAIDGPPSIDVKDNGSTNTLTKLRLVPNKQLGGLATVYFGWTRPSGLGSTTSTAAGSTVDTTTTTTTAAPKPPATKKGRRTRKRGRNNRGKRNNRRRRRRRRRRRNDRRNNRRGGRRL